MSDTEKRQGQQEKDGPSAPEDKQTMCGLIGFGGWCEKNYGHRDSHVYTSKEKRMERELTSVLNRHSAENPSNTPDFILAQYLLGCLAAWNTAVQQRETWYGRDARPSIGMLSAIGEKCVCRPGEKCAVCSPGVSGVGSEAPRG